MRAGARLHMYVREVLSGGVGFSSGAALLLSALLSALLSDVGKRNHAAAP